MMSHTIICSAPAKVILFGEQVVVLGRTAIATALDLRTYVKLTSSTDDHVSIQLPDLNTTASWPASSLHYPDYLSNNDELNAGLAAFLDKLAPGDRGLQAFLYLAICVSQNNLKPFQVTVKSEFQHGVGLGSSAAYNVALAAALWQFFSPAEDHLESAPARNWIGSRKPRPDAALRINSWAFNAEKLMHGTPSGIDNSVSTFGGAVSLKQGQLQPILEVPKLNIVVTNTKVSRNTKILVAKVRELHAKHPSIVEPLLDSVEAISQSVLQLFGKYASETDAAKLADFEKIIEDYIDVNHHVLVALGVGHQSLARVVEVGMKFAVHSKLTGAGGGGCAFSLIPLSSTSGSAALRAALEAEGFDCFDASTGAAGVLVHASSEPPPIF